MSLTVTMIIGLLSPPLYGHVVTGVWTLQHCDCGFEAYGLMYQILFFYFLKARNCERTIFQQKN